MLPFFITFFSKSTVWGVGEIDPWLPESGRRKELTAKGGRVWGDRFSSSTS